MNGLIHASLKNPIAVTVMVLSLVVLGGLSAYSIPVDILPVPHIAGERHRPLHIANPPTRRLHPPRIARQ